MKSALIVAGATTVLVIAFVVYALWPREEPRYSAEELEWIRGFSAWFGETADAAADLYDRSSARRDVDDVEGAVDVLHTCAERLSDVPDPPTDRLEAAERVARRACEETDAALAEYAEAGTAVDPETAHQLRYVFEELAEADRLISERLLLEQPLPELEGVATTSRVDPLLGRVATAVTGHVVEVRCWTRSDWSALEDEFAALGGERNRHYFGIANVWESTAHISPALCRRLAALAYAGELPRRGRARSDLIEALVTLGHEAEHVAGTSTSAPSSATGSRASVTPRGASAPDGARPTASPQTRGGSIARGSWAPRSSGRSRAGTAGRSTSTRRTHAGRRNGARGGNGATPAVARARAGTASRS